MTVKFYRAESSTCMVEDQPFATFTTNEFIYADTFEKLAQTLANAIVHEIYWKADHHSTGFYVTPQ